MIKILFLAYTASATMLLQPMDTEKCAIDFAAQCLVAVDAGACDTCAKALPQGDCSPADSLILLAVCQQAPFNSATESCIKTFIGDCSSKFTNPQECELCVITHAKNLKANNCTDIDIAAETALCKKAAAPTPSSPTPGPPGPTPGPPGPGGQSHYGDPTKGCLSDEEKVQVTGLAGDFCSPDCTTAACPTDVPTGVTATGQCLLKASTGSSKKCCLVCSPTAIIKDQKAADAQCGTATCKAIQTTGICTYDDR
jgi:hypothetical protein